MAIALVTGASGGIGAACARRLVADGHQVALVARREPELRRLARDLGDRAVAVVADVTDAGDTERAYATVEELWGPVGVLVLAAGAGTAAPLTETTDEDWQQMVELNLTAPFRWLRRALPAMTASGSGRVVVIASVVARHGESQVAAYTASKHGVLGLVRAAAAETARTGVTVNAVCPGYVDSPLTAATVRGIAERTGRTPDEARALLAGRQPIGRLITPDEVADAVMMCVGNGAITGQGINVDGGTVQS